MNDSIDFQNPLPFDWPNRKSWLYDLLLLTDRADLLCNRGWTPWTQFSSARARNTQLRLQGKKTHPLARIGWDESRRNLARRHRLDVLTRAPGDVDQQTEYLCRVFDASDSQSSKAVYAYLRRIAGEICDIKWASSELGLSETYHTPTGGTCHGPLAGGELYALVQMQARIFKAGIDVVLFQSIEHFIHALLNWPTSELTLGDLRNLHELAVTPDEACDSQWAVKNKTAANVYLNRVGQLVLDLRVACVELALLKSSDNLDLDIIDRLTLHLSTTTRQTPGEAIKWPLAQVAQLLADTSHGDIRSCSSATGEAAGATASRRKAKRSTERGEARAQIIAALSKHHKYSDDGVLNQEPIANNELARKAEVSRSTASEFFRSQFGGHAKYRRCCRGDNTRLVIALKLLNDEFSPQILYGVAPPGEGEREDDE